MKRVKRILGKKKNMKVQREYFEVKLDADELMLITGLLARTRGIDTSALATQLAKALVKSGRKWDEALKQMSGSVRVGPEESSGDN